MDEQIDEIIAQMYSYIQDPGYFINNETRCVENMRTQLKSLYDSGQSAVLNIISNQSDD